MSYTPRTDAAESGMFQDRVDELKKTYALARTLETQLADCRAALAEMLLFADGFSGKSAFDRKKKKARAILAATAQKGDA